MYDIRFHIHRVTGGKENSPDLVHGSRNVQSEPEVLTHPISFDWPWWPFMGVSRAYHEPVGR